MNHQDQSLMLKIEKAQWWALSNQPFYGSLALGLENVLGNPHGKTVCTDGRRIFWDRDFLAKLCDEETRFVLLHETMHPAHGHLWRFPKPDSRTNQACDYAINGRLVKIAGLKMPAGGLQDKAYDDLAEEEILNRLPNPPGGGNGSGKSDDPCGDYTQPADGNGNGQQDGQGKGKEPGKSPGKGQDSGDGNQGSGNGQDGAGKQPESLKEEWERRVIQAVQAAKALGQGLAPSDLQRQIDRTLNQKVDWRRETADFIKDRIAARNDWSRSTRRMAYQPVIYPRKRQDETGLVVVCRDTSGSISDQIMAEFNGLIESCLAECNCQAVILDCDAVVQAEYRVGPGEESPRTGKGGGGTAFEPCFRRAEELIEAGERIAGLIYLTDLAGSHTPTPPDFATLWVCTDPNQSPAPFGRTIVVEC